MTAAAKCDIFFYKFLRICYNILNAIAQSILLFIKRSEILDKFSVLSKYFGYKSFRNGQEQLVDSILSGSDVLGIMPTGAGKSLCYQVPAMLLEGVTIVVSPLISLMQDQVDALRASGIPAGCLNSSLSDEEYRRVLSEAYKGELKIIYAAPERLLSQGFLKLSSQIKISMLTVDEAHCISQWGQDFRPSYLKIKEFINSIKYRPVISAFTATATKEVRDDIIKILELNSPFVLTTGFDRKNLYFEVQTPRDKFTALLRIIEKNRDKCGIVYCSTRKNVEDVCSRLCEIGHNASRYHAGLSDKERKHNQDDFIYDRKTLMVATNAFGMGIDKSNVSFVVHYNMPKNIESYYQEAGRAGRDGEPASCYILYSGQDIRTNMFLINNDENSELDEESRKLVKQKELERLKYMTFYCRTSGCLREFILKYFGDSSSNYCGNCSNCNSNFETVDITIDSQKILSCIYRLRERNLQYGIGMIISILRGSKAEKVIKPGLDTLSTYGIMKDCPERRCREIINLLIENRYITICGTDYPVLTLNHKSREILFEQKQLEMKLVKEQIFSESSQPEDEKTDMKLLSILKELRRKTADLEGVPAYIVFSDSSLKDMCRKMPENKEQFLTVSGVGYIKSEKYGDKFLKTINEYKCGAEN